MMEYLKLFILHHCIVALEVGGILILIL